MEAAPDAALVRNSGDISEMLEACFAVGATGVVLYPANLPEGFFDLSSGTAGMVLQKVRQYGVRMAVVAGAELFSSRFGEMEVEERKSGWFGVFGSREEARGWLEKQGLDVQSRR